MSDMTEGERGHDGFGHRYDFDRSVQGYGICECGARENSEMSVRPCPAPTGSEPPDDLDEVALEKAAEALRETLNSAGLDGIWRNTARHTIKTYLRAARRLRSTSESGRERAGSRTQAASVIHGYWLGCHGDARNLPACSACIAVVDRILAVLGGG